ncbi:hypothetical protein BDR07DRAFT_1375433 [Suillus spraguei]|nr:hypothetical protein BDR07DRAFT_1375433 [Suillus spraguei]
MTRRLKFSNGTNLDEARVAAFRDYSTHGRSGSIDDGTLGIRPIRLTLGTLRNLSTETIPTITDFLYAQGTIYQPYTTDTDDGGESTLVKLTLPCAILHTFLSPPPRAHRTIGVSIRESHTAPLRSSVPPLVSIVAALFFTLPPYSALQNLDFHIDDQTYSLTPNAQIWFRSLKHFYIVLDTANSRVGFSTTLFTANAITN